METEDSYYSAGIATGIQQSKAQQDEFVRRLKIILPKKLELSEEKCWVFKREMDKINKEIYGDFN